MQKAISPFSEFETLCRMRPPQPFQIIVWGVLFIPAIVVFSWWWSWMMMITATVVIVVKHHSYLIALLNWYWFLWFRICTCQLIYVSWRISKRNVMKNSREIMHHYLHLHSLDAPNKSNDCCVLTKFHLPSLQNHWHLCIIFR